jgi:hypothetical protein
MDIEWADPPPDAVFRARNQGGRYTELALALQGRPDTWAKVPEDEGRGEKTAQNLAANIRRGKVKGFTPAGAYEAVNDGASVYVRYLTPKEPGDEDEADPDAVDPKEVREWARANGWPDLGPRGRIGGEILEAYQAAHPAPGLRSV